MVTWREWVINVLLTLAIDYLGLRSTKQSQLVASLTGKHIKITRIGNGLSVDSQSTQSLSFLQPQLHALVTKL